MSLHTANLEPHSEIRILKLEQPCEIWVQALTCLAPHHYATEECSLTDARRIAETAYLTRSQFHLPTAKIELRVGPEIVAAYNGQSWDIS